MPKQERKQKLNTTRRIAIKTGAINAFLVDTKDAVRDLRNLGASAEEVYNALQEIYMALFGATERTWKASPTII